MKKLILMTIIITAFSGVCHTQCFSLWPLNCNKSYDFQELKNFLQGRDVQFDDQNCTIITAGQTALCQSEFKKPMQHVANCLRSLTYVTNVAIKVRTKPLNRETKPTIIGVMECEIRITLKDDAYLQYKCQSNQ